MRNRLRSLSRESRIAIISGIVWLATIYVFTVSFFIVLRVVGELDLSRLPDGNVTNIFMISFFTNILIGIIAFILFGINLLNVAFKKKSYSHFKLLSPLNIITFTIIGAAILTLFTTGTSLILAGDSNPSSLRVNTITTTPQIKEVNWGEELIIKINNERVAKNLNVLAENSKLGLSSTNRLDDIITTEDWSTQSPNGNDHTWYIQMAKYSFGDAAESMVRGFSSPEDSFAALIADKTNKENILNKNLTDIAQKHMLLLKLIQS